MKTKGGEVLTGTFAGRVRQRGRGVEVTSASAAGATLHAAQAAVLAVPRFVAARIVEGFPSERWEDVRAMEWRAYLVANILLARRPKVDWYDAYRVEEIDPRDCGWTDLILADHAAGAHGPYTVLTAYRALPYSGGRNELLTDDDYSRHRDVVRRDLRPWLPALGLREADVVDINLARWGHPLVLAKPGQLASGTLERISAPLGPIVFAQQDRFGVPAIESALEAAFVAADEASKLI
ncbi:MAG TPA: hypothetical protein VEY91_04465 [Candidatus Limnocylindria bacterium]|nr:hypothetical protein [Candidatus Limnocylindria bacterium]